MKKLMLLDGNSIINRAFYGIRPLTAPDGTPTNAVFGFLSILQRLLDEENPDGLCVAFDRREPTFRHQHSAAYKATRKPMPEELAVQMPLMKTVLDTMGIRRCELAGWEADDLLGTLSRLSSERGCECVIVTGDKDSLQLVGENVRVLNVKTRMGQTETINYTPERFVEEYGFAPVRMVDLKALMGDTSDNIPGVPGVGEKTALELIRRFGSLDGVYENLDSPEIKKGVRAKLEAGVESARDSFWLATIDRHAPIDIPEEEMLRPTVFGTELYELFLRLNFRKFIEKLELHPAKAQPVPTAAEKKPTAAPAILHTSADVEAFCAHMGKKLLCVWYDEQQDAAALHTEGETAANAWLSLSAFQGEAQALKQLFCLDIPRYGHNIKNLMRRLLDLGVDARHGWAGDTALAAYLLDATAADYELEKLCPAYCGFALEEGEAGEDQQLSLLEEDSSEEQLALRMAQRAEAVAQLHRVLEPRLEETGCTALYREIELPLCGVLAGMEHRGFLCDREALVRFGENLTEGIEALKERIWQEAGEEFNIQSPKQLSVILFEKMGLPGGKKTKTGWSTNAEVLDKLRGVPLVDDVLEYRELTKLKSTYADGLLKVIGPDGRIHTRFQMTVTATGRLSSVEPNLQNIPVRRELGAGLRRMFVAAPGSVLIDADYSQIELRLLAHISGDENMRAAFLSGEDVHRVTASQVFGIPLSEVTAEERRQAKAVNFGIVYGISAFSLSQDIHVSVAEAKRYMDAYLFRFSGVRDYQSTIVEQARRDGYVATLFGRRRSLPELKSANFNMRSFGERVALNMPIQGTAADIIKLAMVRVEERLEKEGLRARLILQVHDELIVECPEEEAEQAARILQEEMENAVHYSVPLPAEAQSGKNWGEAHG